VSTLIKVAVVAAVVAVAVVSMPDIKRSIGTSKM
jgi:hypothetical protein